MAVYVNLLVTAVAEDGPAGVLDGALLEDLAAAGRDLAISQGNRPAAHALATQLAYDRALIRLCKAMSIEAAPERFAAPVAERRRLEGCLADLGPNWRWFIESLSPRRGPTGGLSDHASARR